MDDLPLQKIQISGPSLASIMQRFSSSPGDVDGLLFGRVSHITPSNFSDDDTTTASAAAAASPSSSATATADSPALIANITSFFSCPSTSSFYDSTGRLNLPSVRRLASSSSAAAADAKSVLLGWFCGRRKTPLRPSLRECSVTASLSAMIDFAFHIENSPKSYSFPPCIFLLLTTPCQDQLIHTHEYRAYQFRLSTESFEPKTLDVINIGPAFRGHYSAFCPNSPFPALPCKLSSVAEEGKGRTESKSLKTVRNVSKDQKEMDMCAEEFDVRRLNRLMGPEAANYTAELEDLYKKMLAKLDGLSRLVEKTSARVLEQENQNMKLRCKVAGLE